eukprot:NODE_195_length_13287_cov_0.482484.p7 type:complete len:286 gc:universal NODE_195_length_13287_cov_0.482484:7531-6674(-)
MTVRKIAKVIEGKWQAEGVGAKVIRSVGSAGFSRCDPFLMLDEFHVKKPAGFPTHPHRGFETLTYMLSGSFQHEDFLGNKGKIHPGDFQYMTAGRGILHSEQPLTDDAHGLQLWINLPKDKKLVEPRYQDQVASNIPQTVIGDAKIKVIAGEAGDVSAVVFTYTPMVFLDVVLEGKVDLPVRNDFDGFLYILEGDCTIDDKVYKPHHTLVLNATEQNSDIGTISISSAKSRLVLVAGVPINEPIAQRGPFVMNSSAEIEQAIDDFYQYKNGFEKGNGFQASIDKK